MWSKEYLPSCEPAQSVIAKRVLCSIIHVLDFKWSIFRGHKNMLFLWDVAHSHVGTIWFLKNTFWTSNVEPIMRTTTYLSVINLEQIQVFHRIMRTTINLLVVKLFFLLTNVNRLSRAKKQIKSMHIPHLPTQKTKKLSFDIKIRFRSHNLLSTFCSCKM